MDKLRIFLSGPMTGYENFNFDKFNFIENVLQQYGVDVVSPVHICKKYKKEHVLSNKAVFDKMVAEQQEAEKTWQARQFPMRCGTIQQSSGLRLTSRDG